MKRTKTKMWEEEEGGWEEELDVWKEGCWNDLVCDVWVFGVVWKSGGWGGSGGGRSDVRRRWVVWRGGVWCVGNATDG